MRRVCIFTGTRAEWGLLSWTAGAVREHADLELQLIVSGTHLSPEFGLTYEQIERDGFSIDRKVEILLSSDTSVGVSKAMGLGLISFAEAFDSLKPDVVVVLGDRFEVLAFAAAATVSRIPIAHFHGGEATYGAMDESFRHAVTKMSHLHFTATEKYRQRVIQMGERPERVFYVGAPGVENIHRLQLMEREEFFERLGLPRRRRLLSVTYHPETLELDSTGEAFSNLLEALDKLEDTNLVFTKANADMKGRLINKMIDEYVESRPECAVAYASMGRHFYLSSLKYVDAVVGNSSSGIIEAPTFQIGTVDIGDRQKGRVRAESVVGCEATTDAIYKAIEKVTSSSFKEVLSASKNPYDQGMVSEKAVAVLATYPLDGILKKEFYEA